MATESTEEHGKIKSKTITSCLTPLYRRKGVELYSFTCIGQLVFKCKKNQSCFGETPFSAAFVLIAQAHPGN